MTLHPGEVVALIAVRSQDYERVQGISGFSGRALLGYTIAAAQGAKHVRRTVVTTSSSQIQQDAIGLGVQAPFLRPAALAGQGVGLAAVLRHTLEWLEEHESYRPEICVSLEVAHPLRPAGIIDQVIEALVTEHLDTVFAAADERSPFWRISENGDLRELEPGATRATRDPLYRQLSGLASATRASVIRSGRTIGDRVGVVPVRDVSALVDIQDDLGLVLLRQMLLHHEL